MTTRRTDKTRKPPNRRAPVRAAARTDGHAKSDEIKSDEIKSDEPKTDEITSGGTASEPEQEAGTETLAAPQTTAVTAEAVEVPEVEASEDAAVDETIDGGAEPAALAVGDIVTQEPVVEASVPVEAVAGHEPTGRDAAEQEASSHEAAPDDAAETLAGQDQAEEPPVVEPLAEAAETAHAPAPAAPERSAATDRGEVPLAAMQGFIEINGRLVAFLQGEGQAALVFWMAALAARSPGDLAQLQAAEMSRALDAALACWTDLARQMGRLRAFTPPRARAA
ncbi:hypothetical protein [Methylobacterium nonmethylotrophicum]|uniref:Phasin domain-containing protein n=1 Tax=Methylobacterium nonmethylotrophicum TaxID=1141884 RepID=A0A4Z0NWV1_9HYPH|nr:hypothetical protein [Methylobacterium nonmethylotrophicum]TGE01804.1 hypothetical protein EU555_03790 [Methylobacterium nonmethylotrophicum]